MRNNQVRHKYTKKIYELSVGIQPQLSPFVRVSKGDRDYVTKVLEILRVERLLHGVAQKPGKPLFTGRSQGKLVIGRDVELYSAPNAQRRSQGKLVIGLPANPAAAIICFYEYVYPLLRKMMGYPEKEMELPQMKLPVLFPSSKMGSRTFKLPKGKSSFLKGRLSNGGVRNVSSVGIKELDLGYLLTERRGANPGLCGRRMNERYRK
jgi:hypothetical protein